MKLYYSPFTSAFRPRWVLEETGQPHELVRLTLAPADLKSPDYLRLHPLGQVPTLVDGDLVLIESAAICMHLAEIDPAKMLLPSSDVNTRAYYHQWIFYAMDTVSPIVHAVYLRWFLAAAADKATVATPADQGAIRRVLAPLDGLLARSPFLLGDRISTADIVLGGVLQWAEAAGLLIHSPIQRDYYHRLRERPAYQRALK